MKVGIFVAEAKYSVNTFNTISGHVQVPLFSANILEKHGYDVTLITSKAPAGYQLPPSASKKLSVETVISASKKWPDQGTRLLRVPLLINELRKLILSSNFDIIHAFGDIGTAYLLGLLKATKISTTAFMTFHNFSISRFPFVRLFTTKLLKNIDALITLTNYTKMQMLQSGLGFVVDKSKAIVMQPGIEKEFRVDRGKLPSLNPKQCVLFWRNANRENGADVCAEVFKQLSREYPDASFIFAVRPGDEYDEELSRISQIYENIELLFYPYTDNIRIEDLLALATVVVLPFRKLSINPQLVVLETLASGTPLVTTPVESNREIIKHRETGILVSLSVNEIATALRELLSKPSFARKIGINAKYHIQKEWNWEKYGEKLIKLYEEVKMTKRKSKRFKDHRHYMQNKVDKPFIKISQRNEF